MARMRMMLNAGLNMLNQAREFNETVPLTGLILTKVLKNMLLLDRTVSRPSTDPCGR